MTAVPILLPATVPPSGPAWSISTAEPPLLFSGDEEIYAQGGRAEHFYRVEFGAVRVYRLLADGRRQISSFHLCGEIFGFEVDSVHRFFADAIGTTGVRPVARSGDTTLDAEIMASALVCLVRTQEHLLVVGRQNAAERVATFLLDMAERQGDPQCFDLPMSRADIGDYLGLTIETVSRVFSRLRAEGIIRLVSLRTLCIQKPSALKALCT